MARRKKHEVIQLWTGALPHVSRRAERSEGSTLRDTFVEMVDVDLLTRSRENQIIFGRRGTGKTHVLNYMAEILGRQEEVVVLADLRIVGSASAYQLRDESSFELAATRIVVDLLATMHEQLFAYSLRALDQERDVTQLVRGMDAMAEAASAVTISGTSTVTEESRADRSREHSLGLEVSTGGGRVHAGGSANVQYGRSHTRSASGQARPALLLGEVQRAIQQVIQSLPKKRIWILIDEWSSLPIPFQPLVADFIRRSLLPCNGLILKMAAVDRRTQLVESHQGGYVGLELGSDVFLGADLDGSLARILVRGRHDLHEQILCKHATAFLQSEGSLTPGSQLESDELLEAFPAFLPALHFSGGVPRDLISIAGLAATIARSESEDWSPSPINASHVIRAARNYAVQEKEAQAKTAPRSWNLLIALREHVQSEEGGSIFLVDSTHESINEEVADLLDLRLLHRLEKSVGPGGRFDAFAIDLSASLISYGSGHYRKREDDPWRLWGRYDTAANLFPVLRYHGGKYMFSRLSSSGRPKNS